MTSLCSLALMDSKRAKEALQPALQVVKVVFYPSSTSHVSEPSSPSECLVKVEVCLSTAVLCCSLFNMEGLITGHHDYGIFG